MHNNEPKPHWKIVSQISGSHHFHILPCHTVSDHTPCILGTNGRIYITHLSKLIFDCWHRMIYGGWADFTMCVAGMRANVRKEMREFVHEIYRLVVVPMYRFVSFITTMDDGVCDKKSRKPWFIIQQNYKMEAVYFCVWRKKLEGSCLCKNDSRHKYGVRDRRNVYVVWSLCEMWL